MARLAVKDVKSRADKAWARKRGWNPLLREAYEFSQPQTNPYHNAPEGATTKTTQEGQSKTNRVFDGTLINSTTKLANRLQSELCPPFQNWAKMVPGPFVAANLKDQAGRELEPITAALFAAIQLSNFDTAINEWFLELVTAGTACMMVQEGNDEKPVIYRTINQSQIALAEGPWGEVWEVHRKFTLRGVLIKPTWKNAKISASLKKAIEDKPDEEFYITEATYYDDDAKVWYYDVCVNGAGVEDERIVETEYDESPWVIARWLKACGEVQGRSPVMMALADAKTLNKLKELVLKNGSLAVSGVWMARDDGVINPNQIRIFPGAVIRVKATGGTAGPSLARLDVGGKLDMAQLVAQDLTMAIKAALFDKGLPDEAGPVRSVTEILQRLKELQQDLGAPFGRVTMEGLVPILQKTLYHLSKKGVVPTVKGQTLKLNSGYIQVQFQSPLAQQQNLSEVENAVKWMQLCQSFGQEAFALGVKVEDAPSYFGRRMGVASELMRTTDERSKLQQMVGVLVKQQMAAQTGAGPVPANANTGQGIPVAA